MKYYVYVNYEHGCGEVIEFDDLKTAYEYYQKECNEVDCYLLYGYMLIKNFYA